MNEKLTHLPDNKQQELNELVQIILNDYPSIAMIILFGSYARGDWVEEKADDGVHFVYQSDYDIFVVAGSTEQAHKIETDLWLRNEFRRVANTPVSLIAHGIECFNCRLGRGQYFFLDVKREGVCLYDSKRFTLAKARKLHPNVRKNLAQEDFDFWRKSAKSFYKQFKFAFNESELAVAAFLLHQVTERLYTATLLVFTRYKSKSHDLGKLNQLVCGQVPQFLHIFPQGSAEEKRRFELLRSAYVDARYKKTYHITCEELLWLEERIKALMELTEKLCIEKIASFISLE